MSYHHLIAEQREKIFSLKEKLSSYADIADEVGCHKSTISRELSRNGGLPVVGVLRGRQGGGSFRRVERRQIHPKGSGPRWRTPA